MAVADEVVRRKAFRAGAERSQEEQEQQHGCIVGFRPYEQASRGTQDNEHSAEGFEA